jgi:acetyltransferase-like isoleucine patch superfamily enzyme
LSLIPGRPGNILRVGYYKLTTAGFATDSYMGFGSFIAKPTARVGRNVSIGAYSIIGGAIIEDDVLIASRCSIMSGKYQHVDYLRRDGAPEADTDGVRIGRSSWIGENCVIMTRVGSNCVVSAGSVVTRPMAAGLTVIGNPARPIRMASQQHPSAAGPDRAVRPPERSEPVKQGVSHDSIRP